MKNVSRWFTLVPAVALGIIAAGCGSNSMSGPSEVVSGSGTGEQGSLVSKAAAAARAGEIELVGYVKSAAPHFTVAGHTVVVTSTTEITRNKTKVKFGSIKVGEHVKVQGVLRSDGKVQAREIKVAYKGGTPNTIPGDSPPHHGGNDDGPNHDGGDDNGGGNDDNGGDNGGGNGGDDGSGHN
jgi:hypothetical protein